MVKLYWQGEIEVLRESGVSVLLCKPQIQPRSAWDRSYFSAVRGWPLPISFHSLFPHDMLHAFSAHWN